MPFPPQFHVSCPTSKKQAPHCPGETTSKYLEYFSNNFPQHSVQLRNPTGLWMLLTKPLFPALNSIFGFGFLSSFYGWITFSITLFFWLLWEPRSFWISVIFCPTFTGLYFSLISARTWGEHFRDCVGSREIVWDGTKGFWNLKSRITWETMLHPSESGSS